MGTTNDYRACELVAVWRYKHGAMVVDGVLDDLRSEVTKALDKEHKRGRRKERKSETCQPCSCPKCGEMLIIPRKVVKADPQIDAEKVRGLINALRDKEFELGKVFEMKDRREYLALGNSVVDAERALLAALDINDK